MSHAPRSRRLLAAVASIAVISLGACGGDDDSDDSRSDVYGGQADFTFEVKDSLVPKGFSAGPPGEIENYEPKGELVADSDFRPTVNGFAFENYGNDAEPRNLRPQEMVELFGEQVCLSGTGADCQLIPAAKQWMENQNAGMAGGHCEGFSMAALAMFDDDLQPDDFGAPVTAGLEIVDNQDLQATIAEHFVYQLLPSVLSEQLHGTPTQIVNSLIEALENDEHYTLGIYKADGTGGHAITPYAVEDQGDGKFAILVYDNNFPGAQRAVQVDTNTDTWSYVGGTNPKDLNQVYEGDATTNTLELDPLEPGQGVQPCPFCTGEEIGEGGEKGSVLPESEQYTEITLSGDPANHPHLIFEDDKGRQTGIVDGRIKEEIPDVEIVKTYATENWGAAPEPRFRLPEGKDYTITIDGSDLTKKTTASVDLVGNGLVIEVDDIKMIPGQQDAMALPGGYGITYGSDSKTEIAPNFFIGLVEDDSALIFAGSAVGLTRGSAFSLVVEQEEKVMYVDSTGSTGSANGKAAFILNLTKADADGHLSQWQRDFTLLDGAKEEKAGFEYGTSPKEGKPLPLVILDANAEVKKVVKAPAQKVDQ